MFFAYMKVISPPNKLNHQKPIGIMLDLFFSEVN